MEAFDFDKTLTKKDTLFGFYKAVHGGGWRFESKRLALLAFAVLYKLKVLSNTGLKKAGVWLFLKGTTQETIASCAERYAQSVEWNALYHNHFLRLPASERVVVSASLEEYLLPLFPDNLVFGSQLRYRNGRVAGLQRNLYGAAKVALLKQQGLDSFEAVYSDSMVDTPLFSLGKKTFRVEGDRVTEIEAGV